MRGIWKKDGDIRITGATKVHHLQLLKVEDAGIKEKCIKWIKWHQGEVDKVDKVDHLAAQYSHLQSSWVFLEGDLG